MIAQTFQARILKLRERVDEIFDIGEAASVGTTSLDNVLTRISWSGSEMAYTPLVKNDVLTYLAEGNVAFLPLVVPGRLLAYIRRKSLILFDIALKTVYKLDVLSGFLETFQDAALMNKGMIVATSLKFGEGAELMKETRRLLGLQLKVNDVEVRWELPLPNEAMVHVSRHQLFVIHDKAISIYDRNLGPVDHPLSELPELLRTQGLSPLSGLAVHPDQCIAIAVDQNRTGHLISWQEGRLALLFSQPNSPLYEFSPDGAYLLFWSGRKPNLRLHITPTIFQQDDINKMFTAKEIAVFDPLPSKKVSIWLSNPSGYAIIDDDGQTLYYWNLEKIMR